MTGILDGIRVIDAGTVLAAPGMSALLSDFGAEVIKVEQPITGDPLRSYTPQIDGEGLTSKVTNRGKRSVTLNLSNPTGRDTFVRLADQADVVVMNYRLPAVKRWRIDYPDLSADNPKLIMLHLTGYGRTGPYADRPGFARAAEAYIGLTYATGYPDRAPVPSGYAIADALGGPYGAFAIMLALFERAKSGEGQLIDLSLYEGLAKTLDGMYIGSFEGHEPPQRVGTVNPTIAPHDIYPMNDDRWVSIPASTQNMFERLCQVLGIEGLIVDSRFTTNELRVAHRDALDAEIRPRLAALSSVDFLASANAAGIAAAPINDAKQFTDDEHVLERGTFENIWDPSLQRDIRMQGVVPKFSRTPGNIDFPGEPLGHSTRAVLGDWLGVDDGEWGHLVSAGAV